MLTTRPREIPDNSITGAKIKDDTDLSYLGTLIVKTLIVPTTTGIDTTKIKLSSSETSYSYIDGGFLIGTKTKITDFDDIFQVSGSQYITGTIISLSAMTATNFITSNYDLNGVGIRVGTVEGGLATETQIINTHVNGPTNVHLASAISYESDISGDATVKNALDDIDGRVETHLSDTHNAHPATAISNDSEVEGDDVKSALNELNGRSAWSSYNLGEQITFNTIGWTDLGESYLDYNITPSRLTGYISINGILSGALNTKTLMSIDISAITTFFSKDTTAVGHCIHEGGISDIIYMTSKAGVILDVKRFQGSHWINGRWEFRIFFSIPLINY